MLSKRKKNEARKAKKEERRDSESQDCQTQKLSKFYFLRMPELRKLILLLLDQKASKSTTCKRLCGKF